MRKLTGWGLVLGDDIGVYGVERGSAPKCGAWLWLRLNEVDGK